MSCPQSAWSFILGFRATGVSLTSGCAACGLVLKAIADETSTPLVKAFKDLPSFDDGGVFTDAHRV